MPTARVRHAGQVEQRLDRAVLAAPAVQREEGHVAVTARWQTCRRVGKRFGIHPRQLLRSRWELLHDALREHALLVGLGELSLRRIDRAYGMSARSQRFGDPEPRREGD